MMYILYDTRRGYVVYDRNHKKVGFFISEQQAINFIYQNKQLGNMYNNAIQSRSANSLQNNHYPNELNNVITFPNTKNLQDDIKYGTDHVSNESLLKQPIEIEEDIDTNSVTPTVGPMNDRVFDNQNNIGMKVNQSLQIPQETNINNLNKKLEKIQEQIDKLVKNNSNTNDEKIELNNAEVDDKSNSFRKYLQNFQNSYKQNELHNQKNIKTNSKSNSFVQKAEVDSKMQNAAAVSQFDASKILSKQEIPFAVQNAIKNAPAFGVNPINMESKISNVAETNSEPTKFNKKLWIISIASVLVIGLIATIATLAFVLEWI